MSKFLTSQNFYEAKTIEELRNLNLKFIKGEISSTPYYGATLDEESEEIILELTKMNELGFITTCSQPGLYTEVKQRGFVAGLIEKSKVNTIKEKLNCDDVFIHLIYEDELDEPYCLTYDCDEEHTHVPEADEPCEAFIDCKIWDELVDKYVDIIFVDKKWGRSNYIHKKVVEALQ